MEAFIVRPFGVKDEIDFDKVQAELIDPALAKLGIPGGTTGVIMQAGNIREDMFRQLLVADLVIADISIHNANVFYELGVRQALRPRRTVLVRAKRSAAVSATAPGPDKVPFDVATDRYYAYDLEDLEGSLAGFTKTLSATVDSEEHDSPIYRLLPGLVAPNWQAFLAVPRDFKEAVRRAERSVDSVLLALLSDELITLPIGWACEGLRLVGVAQSDLGDWPGARRTWEEVRRTNPTDLEANTRLATVYQKLGRQMRSVALLQRSDDAIARVLEHKTVQPNDYAEISALEASNAKTHWLEAWQRGATPKERRSMALASPYLTASYQAYERGFLADCNHYYSGLNALAMLTLLVSLADQLAAEFTGAFPTEQEAQCQLRGWKACAAELSGSVATSLRSARQRAGAAQHQDHWISISEADLACLTSSTPSHVEAMYRKAAAGVGPMQTGAVLRQLEFYVDLGVRSEFAAAGVRVLKEMREAREGEESDGPQRVLVFTGHRVDSPDRPTPRFPASAEGLARKMIADAVAAEKEMFGGLRLGMAGGANGGDILFHEVCTELEIPTEMWLTAPRDVYVPRSVASDEGNWVSRFDAIQRRQPSKTLGESLAPPPWLRDVENYSVWSRTNLWLLHGALAYGAENVTLIALWNGEAGDGPGGTANMVQLAKSRGARTVILDAKPLAAAKEPLPESA